MYRKECRFHVYPGAEVVLNSNPKLPPAPALEPNSVNWETGDIIENSHFQVFKVNAHTLNIFLGPPAFQSVATDINLSDPGVCGDLRALSIQNRNPWIMYTDPDLALNPPSAVFPSEAWAHLMFALNGPAKDGAGIFVENPGPGVGPTDPTDVYNCNYAPGGHLTFHPEDSSLAMVKVATLHRWRRWNCCWLTGESLQLSRT